ncbi:MAG: DUF302 domain-containing protein [Phycisphaerales bacterium]
MIDYTIETKLTVSDAVNKLQTKLAENNFSVMHIYNLKDIFTSKGIEFGEYQILSVCNAKFAKQALDINLKLGQLLPCKISVYTEKGKTKISLQRPTQLAGLLEDEQVEPIAKNVEEILVKAIDSIL